MIFFVCVFRFWYYSLRFFGISFFRYRLLVHKLRKSYKTSTIILLRRYIFFPSLYRFPFFSLLVSAKYVSIASMSIPIFVTVIVPSFQQHLQHNNWHHIHLCMQCIRCKKYLTNILFVDTKNKFLRRLHLDIFRYICYSNIYDKM